MLDARELRAASSMGTTGSAIGLAVGEAVVLLVPLAVALVVVKPVAEHAVTVEQIVVTVEVAVVLPWVFVA